MERTGIICPHCNSTRWRVKYARRMAGHIERRRECRQCGKRVTTQERKRDISDATGSNTNTDATMQLQLAGGYCQYADR